MARLGVSTRAERRWAAAVREHNKALAGFTQAARRLSEAEWGAEIRPGAWTRGQIAEHLALAYEGLLRELAGEAPIRVVGSPLQQRLLRWFLLPHMLFHRSFPIRSRAVRELRPSGEPLDRGVALRRLNDAGGRFVLQLDAARHNGGARLHHPYFGAISPTRALRFCAVHVEHHTRQLRG